MKPYNEYLAMTAEQIMADPEAPGKPQNRGSD